MSLRIVQANSFHYRRGGDAAQFLDLVSALSRRDHEVAVFSMQHPENLPSPWSQYWVSHAEYRGRLRIADRVGAAWRSTYSRDAHQQMRRLVRDFRPDVVHFHSVHHHLTTAAVGACLDMGVPVVWTLHDYRTVCPATSLLRANQICERCADGGFWHAVAGRCKSGELSRSVAAAAESYITRVRGTLARVDCYIAPSRFLAETVARMGLPARRIEVVPNPVTIARDARSPERTRGSAEILYVGRLSAEKGVDVLVRAAAARPELRVGVVGDGPQGEALKELALRSGACVTFEGWLDPADVRRRMHDAAVLCVPSVWYENCPGVVLEAMAVGLPVVASDLGGLTELLDGGRAGWLAPAGDPTALAAVLARALAEREASARLAQNALRRVRGRHDPETFIGRIEEIYRSVAVERGDSRAS